MFILMLLPVIHITGFALTNIFKYLLFISHNPQGMNNQASHQDPKDL